MQPALTRLFHRNAHDFRRDGGDLDVHLKRGNPHFRPGYLEIHIAEVIFITQNIGQHGEATIFLDQTHRDTSAGALQRHAGIHHGKRGPANRRHGRRTIAFGDFGDNAHRVGEFFFLRQQRMNGAPGKLAMAHFTPAGAAHAARFIHRIGREIIVQHEIFAVFTGQRINHLLILAGAECGHA